MTEVCHCTPETACKGQISLFGQGVPCSAGKSKPSDGQSDSENDCGTAYDLPRGTCTISELVLAQGNVGRNAHDEHKEGEDEVCRCETIPFSMAERSIDVRPRAGIVHGDHSGDGDAAQDVERKQSLSRLMGHGCSVGLFVEIVFAREASEGRNILHPIVTHVVPTESLGKAPTNLGAAAYFIEHTEAG